VVLLVLAGVVDHRLELAEQVEPAVEGALAVGRLDAPAHDRRGIGAGDDVEHHGHLTPVCRGVLCHRSFVAGRAAGRK